jgi:hypothetical protein
MSTPFGLFHGRDVWADAKGELMLSRKIAAWWDTLPGVAGTEQTSQQPIDNGFFDSERDWASQRLTDRRRERRMLAQATGSMRVLAPIQNDRLDVRILNTSQSGLKIRANQFLPPGAMVHVHLPGNLILGEVRYCLDVGAAFHVGISIQEAESIIERVLKK